MCSSLYIVWGVSVCTCVCECSTTHNATSSRSHAIFTLRLTKRDSSGPQLVLVCVYYFVRVWPCVCMTLCEREGAGETFFGPRTQIACLYWQSHSWSRLTELSFAIILSRWTSFWLKYASNFFLSLACVCAYVFLLSSKGCLNFVDLAGSERLPTSGPQVRKHTHSRTPRHNHTCRRLVGDSFLIFCNWCAWSESLS